MIADELGVQQRALTIDGFSIRTQEVSDASSSGAANVCPVVRATAHGIAVPNIPVRPGAFFEKIISRIMIGTVDHNTAAVHQ